jgi:putative Holliday junction resolvase
MPRILGVDYGRARVGLAVSDEGKILSRPLCVIENGRLVFEKLKTAIAPLLPIETVVIGLPLHLNGKESPMSGEVRQFAEKLKEALSLSVIFWDERLTSALADRTLKEAGLNRKKRAELEDKVAASLMLQSYLDSLCTR